jgi:hypothetical protein
VGEWLSSGLQNRVHRFKSGPGLCFRKDFMERKEPGMGKTDKVLSKIAIEAVDLALIPLIGWGAFDIVTNLSVQRIIRDGLAITGGFVLLRWMRQALTTRARNKGVDLGRP